MNNTTYSTIMDEIENKKEKKKPLNIEFKNKKFTIYGGSCHEPLIDDVDIYVSLDVEQPVYYWEQPWYESENKKHLRLPIEDMFIPNDTEEFKSAIDYVLFELSQNKKIHVGCIGGHGRTGIFLSALVQVAMGNKLKNDDGSEISAVEYVRENYSQKAVETVPQLIFLNSVFGIKIPKTNLEEVNEFKKTFKEETGITLEDVLKKDVSIDEIHDVLKEIDSIMYAKSIYNRKAVTRDDFIKPMKP
jgi:protein-tyrosine phosphatase